METETFRIEDGNENICGACRRSGTLICCEYCPAAYHAECAGYRDIEHVPDGDWFCFLCSRKLGHIFHAGNCFVGEVGQEIMIMSDEHGEVFSKAVVTEITEEHVTVRKGQKLETLPLTDRRLWHGTLDMEAWTRTNDDDFRPNSRAYEIDFNELAELEETVAESRTNGESYATFLNRRKKDPREKHFIELLDHFWKVQIGMNGIPWPPFGYLVPLADLWDAVEKCGGYHAVNESGSWRDVGEQLYADRELRNFSFILKHTFRTILRDVEAYGGIEAMETLFKYKPHVEKAIENREEPSLTHETEHLRRRKGTHSRKRKNLLSAEEWISDGAVSHDVLTKPVRSFPRVFSTNRAIQEYRKAIGIVSLTETAKNLVVGDKVDVRTYKNSSLGPWRVGKISIISTASAFEGYRRFRIKYGKWKENERNPLPREEWVTLLARPSAWGTTLSKPAVLVRPPTKPYFPRVRPCVTLLRRGERVEAWLNQGWWPATILEIFGEQALLQGDLIPLGEGLKWYSDLSYIRPACPGEEEGYGMIQPIDLNENVYPKDFERQMNIQVDKTGDGHLILAVKRLDDIPSRK